eukprot:7109373-Alexandrium_andersonii.AAC.1
MSASLVGSEMCIRDSLSPGKPEALKGLSAQRLPTRRSGAGATKTASELGTRSRLGDFRGEGNVH